VEEWAGGVGEGDVEDVDVEVRRRRVFMGCGGRGGRVDGGGRAACVLMTAGSTLLGLCNVLPRPPLWKSSVA